MRPVRVTGQGFSRVLPAVLILVSQLLAACAGAIPFSPLPPASETGSLMAATRTPFQPLTDTAIAMPDGTQASASTPASTEAIATAVPQTPHVEPASPAATTTPTVGPAQENPAGGAAALWAAPYLPERLLENLALPPGWERVEAADQAALRLEVSEQRPVSRWIYALVAPFASIPDGVSSAELRRAWKGEREGGPFAGRPLLMDERTHAAFSAWWGEPAPGATEVLPPDELLDYAWEHQPAWGIIPFEGLEPRWKALEIGDSSPLQKEFDPADWALALPISLAGEAGLADQALSLGLGLPATNRDPDRLTVVALTGVTALVRATAFTMRRNGITYPAEDIGELLRAADITHISNEIPFTPDCPAPNPTQADLRFCSDPSYIELLEQVGADVIELTGDHFGDWGPEAMLYTLERYEEEGWIYYGGGYDRRDARQARLIEHNGNRVAFIGCNAKGGGYATASESQPGAVACDRDWMHAEIGRLRDEGYAVIATFQHFEYYTYQAQPDQVADFRGMAEAGAAVVSGSQAHQPQGMEFHAGAFIHYGLGNLFFDQFNFCTDNACNDGFIDRHVFYDGRYIGTELIPIVFVDYARPRPMNQEEKAALLEKVFSASGW